MLFLLLVSSLFGGFFAKVTVTLSALVADDTADVVVGAVAVAASIAAVAIGHCYNERADAVEIAH